MKIILLKTVPKLGLAGEIKEVSEGYARNFLIPQGLADMPTKHNLRVLEAQKSKKNRLKKENIKKRENDADKINKKKFIIKAKADDKGSLYSKLSPELISQTLKKEGYDIAAKEIIMEKAIKKTGEQKIKLKLAGKTAFIKLQIEKQ